nr:IclR family transcriptional regulator [Actinomycetota bacterium]
LGWGLVSLGRAASAVLPLIELARPVLDSLRTKTGESVQLYVQEGDARRCLVSLESPHGLRWIVPEGSLLPLNAGSAGHVLSGERTDKHGWIQSVGEREAGVASVSAPVLNAQGNIIAAISVSGPIERLTRRPGERHGAVVVRAARSLQRLL